MSLDEQLWGALERRRKEHLYRSRRIIEGPQGPEVIIKGRSYLSFCSNDYLGLANHPEVVATLQQGAQAFGAGSGASHLITGHSLPHHALEEELAAFTERPRALLFSTGYMANLGTVSVLVGRGDAVFEDRLNHASLIDAGRLSGARFRRYAHAEVAALEQGLTRQDAPRKLVVTDGVFSMDGDLAPLPELAGVTRRQGAWLMVDDAHGLGVIGNTGRGTTEHFGLGMDEVPILVGTLGKAFGTFGAFVAGSEALIEGLIQWARPYGYTTALPPAIAEATRRSLRLMDREGWRRTYLATLVQRFRQGAAQLGLALMSSHTPIQPLVIGDAKRALELSEALLSKGILISAIRPPTVPQGSARLRITVSAAHRETHVDRLLEALGQVMPPEEV